MNQQGYRAGEIAKYLGMSRGSYDWFAYRKNAFGHLLRRQGQQRRSPEERKKNKTDDERRNVCYGVSDWQQRRDKIKANWQPSERVRRSYQQLPKGEKLYGLDRRFQQKHDTRKDPQW